MGDDADFLALEVEAAAALARQQAENGFSESSSGEGNERRQAVIDDNEAQLQALFLNQ